MTSDTGITDELDEYLAEQMQDPAFVRAYAEAAAHVAMRPGTDVTCWECLGWWKRERCTLCHPEAFTGPLCIDGEAYARKRAARKRRRHGR